MARLTDAGRPDTRVAEDGLADGYHLRMAEERLCHLAALLRGPVDDAGEVVDVVAHRTQLDGPLLRFEGNAIGPGEAGGHETDAQGSSLSHARTLHGTA